MSDKVSPWANIKTVKPGDWLQAAEGFSCLEKGDLVEVRQNEKGELYVPCEMGRHYLDGQLRGDEILGFLPNER